MGQPTLYMGRISKPVFIAMYLKVLFSSPRIPFVGVSVALVVDKKVVVGAGMLCFIVTDLILVYNPILDELFTAIRGQGSYLNGERLTVSSTSHMQNALVATGFPYDIHNQTLINNIVTNLGTILKNTRAGMQPCLLE